MRKLTLGVVVGLALALLLADLFAPDAPVAASGGTAAAEGPRNLDEEVAARESLAAAAAELVDPESLARPRCISDLIALDAMPGLGGIRAAFERGLPDGDAAIAEYLRALVAQKIGASTDVALEVLALAEQAPPDEAAILLEGLSRSEGAKDPRIARRLIALGQKTDGDTTVRAAALDALRTQPRLDGDGRRALSALAVDERSDEAAWHATRALGSVMGQAHGRGDAFEPYWDELEKIARTSEAPAVRALALEAPMHADTILGADRIEKLTALLPDEPHRDVRELAIFQLGLTDNPEQALAALERAFVAEYDVCVRWAIVRFAVRAAGARALPLLDRFAAMDPAFVEDVRDFRALFAAGHQDFEQIWLRMPDRHFCAVEDGEPHGGDL